MMPSSTPSGIAGRRRGAGIACAMFRLCGIASRCLPRRRVADGLSDWREALRQPIFPPKTFMAVLAEADLVEHEPKLAAFSGIRAQSRPKQAMILVSQRCVMIRSLRHSFALMDVDLPCIGTMCHVHPIKAAGSVVLDF